jgi:hypothetical protein
VEKKEPRWYCRECACERKANPCPKCGKECFTPHYDWEEPALPDIEQIRALAREIGYAVGVHGTLERDLDIILAPWTEEALKYNYREVMEYIAKGMNAKLIEVELKPLGRRAGTIQIDGWYKAIDISVAPMYVDNKGNVPGKVQRIFEFFQKQVMYWFRECFTEEKDEFNLDERALRYAEESVELVQSCDISREKMHEVVDYVYNRPKGEFEQEVGGALTTMAVLCESRKKDMIECGFNELSRIWTKIPLIREKQKTKIH